MTAINNNKLILSDEAYSRLKSQFIVSTTDFYNGTPCWISKRRPNPEGYTMFWDGTTERPAHKTMYETTYGIIPDGLVCDHLCRVRRCMNPDHIEPVTDRENILRGEGLCAKYAVQTHCKQGHEYTEASTKIRIGKNGHKQRHCRICTNQRYKDFHTRLKELPYDHPKRIQYRNMHNTIRLRNYHTKKIN